MNLPNDRKTIFLLQAPLAAVGCWCAVTYGYTLESSHTGWLRLTDVLSLVSVSLALFVVVVITSARPAVRNLAMWVVLPTYALIGSRLGYIVAGSFFDHPAIGGLIGAATGFFFGNFARRALIQNHPSQEHAS